MPDNSSLLESCEIEVGAGDPLDYTDLNYLSFVLFIEHQAIFRVRFGDLTVVSTGPGPLRRWSQTVNLRLPHNRDTTIHMGIAPRFPAHGPRGRITIQTFLVIDGRRIAGARTAMEPGASRLGIVQGGDVDL